MTNCYQIITCNDVFLSRMVRFESCSQHSKQHEHRRFPDSIEEIFRYFAEFRSGKSVIFREYNCCLQCNIYATIGGRKAAILGEIERRPIHQRSEALSRRASRSELLRKDGPSEKRLHETDTCQFKHEFVSDSGCGTVERTCSTLRSCIFRTSTCKVSK